MREGRSGHGVIDQAAKHGKRATAAAGDYAEIELLRRERRAEKMMNSLFFLKARCSRGTEKWQTTATLIT